MNGTEGRQMISEDRVYKRIKVWDYENKRKDGEVTYFRKKPKYSGEWTIREWYKYIGEFN